MRSNQTWDRKKLDQLKAEGKIRGYVMPAVVEHKTSAGRIVSKHFKRQSKALDWISSNLLYWCNAKCITLMEEYQFDPTRKWRFDFAMPSMMVAVEFEGGVFQANTSHNSARTFTKDTDKYNSAQALGWTVLRFTALNYTNLLTELNKHL